MQILAVWKRYAVGVHLPEHRGEFIRYVADFYGWPYTSPETGPVTFIISGVQDEAMAAALVSLVWDEFVAQLPR